MSTALSWHALPQQTDSRTHISTGQRGHEGRPDEIDGVTDFFFFFFLCGWGGAPPVSSFLIAGLSFCIFYVHISFLSFFLFFSSFLSCPFAPSLC